MRKNDEFGLKKVTINFNHIEDEMGSYYEIDAVETRSPCYYPCSNANEISFIFAKWLENTLKAMPKNNCKTIQFVCTWN